MSLKKSSLIVVLLLVGVLIFNFSAAYAEKGKLQVWNLFGQPTTQKAFKEIFAEFEAKTGYTIELSSVPRLEYGLKWAAATATKKEPDMIIHLPHWMVTEMATGQFEPLDDIVNMYDDWLPNILHDIEYNGHYYGVPWHGSVVFLYYRKDIFEEKGLKPPTNWSELEATALKLTGNGKYGLPIPASKDLVGSYMAYAFMRTNDAYVYDKEGNIAFNNPRTVETFEFLRRLYKTVSNPSSTGYDFGSYKNAFWSGQVAMLVYYGSIYPDMKRFAPDLLNKTGFTRLPINEKLGYVPEKYTINQSSSYVIPSRSKNKKVMKDLIRFLMEPKNNIKVMNADPADCLPVRDALVKDPAYWANPTVAEFKDAVEFQLKEIKNSSELFMANGKHPFNSAIFGSFALGTMFQNVALKDVPVSKLVENLDKKYRDIAGE